MQRFNVTEQDLRLLTTLASQAAIAVQNARLVRSLKSERDKLLEIPGSDSDKEVSLVTRPAIEAFIKQSGATLWIQHDMVLFRTLRKSPEYYE